MLVLLFLLCCSFIAILALEFRFRSPFIIVWLALFAVFFIPHSFDVAYRLFDYRPSTYDAASCFCLGFNLSYLGIRAWLSHRNETVIRCESVHETNPRVLRFLDKLFPAIALLFLLSLLSQSQSILEVTWVDIRSESGYGNLVLAYLWNVAAASVIYLLIVKRTIKCWVYVATFLAIAVLLRSRGYLIPVLFPLLVYSIYQSSNLVKKALVSTATAGAIVFLVLMVIQIRYLGRLDSFLDTGVSGIFQSSLSSIAEKKGELRLREGLYQYIEVNEVSHLQEFGQSGPFKRFGRGVTYRRIALLPIPTALTFGMKPADLIYDMGWAMGMNGAGSSYHPTLYGDVYANFGFGGFIFGIFYGLVAFVSDRALIWARRRNAQWVLLPPLCYFYVFVARGSVYNAFAVAFWCGVLVWLLLRVLPRQTPGLRNVRRSALPRKQPLIQTPTHAAAETAATLSSRPPSRRSRRINCP